jgi:hypothetical protein
MNRVVVIVVKMNRVVVIVIKMNRVKEERELSRGQVRCTVEGAAMRSTVVFNRLSTVRQ